MAKNAVPSFDTLAYAKKLEARGVEVKQAEAHAEVLAEVLEARFITKKDSDIALNNNTQALNMLRSEMHVKFSDMQSDIAAVKSEVDLLRSDMKSDIAAVKSEVDLLRSDMKSEIAAVKSEVDLLRSDMKSEIAIVKNDMKSEVNLLRSDMKAEIATVKSEVIKWVFGISFAQAALILSVLKFFH